MSDALVSSPKWKAWVVESEAFGLSVGSHYSSACGRAVSESLASGSEGESSWFGDEAAGSPLAAIPVRVASVICLFELNVPAKGMSSDEPGQERLRGRSHHLCSLNPRGGAWMKQARQSSRRSKPSEV